jgi:hypothetical protein
MEAKPGLIPAMRMSGATMVLSGRPPAELIITLSDGRR